MASQKSTDTTAASADEKSAPVAKPSEAERLKSAQEKFVAAHGSPPDVAAEATATHESPVTPPEASPPVVPVVSPQLEAVVTAQRRAEVQISAQKDALAKERAELDARKAEIAQAAELLKMAKLDPVRFYREMVKADPALFDDYAKALHFAAQPEDKRPADFKNHSDILSLKAEMDEVKRENAAMKDAQATKEKQAEEARLAHENKVAADTWAKEGIGKAPAESKYLRALYAAEPDEAASLYLETAGQVYLEKYGGEGPEVPTHEEISARVEEVLAARLKPFESVFQPAKITTAETPKREQKSVGVKTLSHANTQTPTQSRPPATTEAERLKRAQEVVSGMWK